jgi:tRNA(Ile)-lysidine synthase
VEETGEIFEFSLCDKREWQVSPGESYLDFDCLSTPLWLRSRKNGDVFHPKCMVGSKKLKKYFIDSKIPFFERDRIAMLVSTAGEIYAIPGIRDGEKGAITACTKTILVIKKH